MEEVEPPVPAPDEVIVTVTAVGLNFFDTLLLQNKYQVTPPLPYSPGAEIAGRVESLGSEVSGISVGERVAAFIGGNGCQEKVAVKAEALIPIPDAVSDEVAAGLPVTYGTALYGWQDRAELKAEETVAILGAAGGAGLAAIEVAKLMGARVIAVGSSGEKLALCREHGADEGLNYRDEDLKTGLKRLTNGRGVDVIYDCVGGEYSEAALRATAWHGRFLVIGFASGKIPRIPLNIVMLKGCSVIGVFWTAFVKRNPDRHRANTLKVLDWVARGLITPHIHGSFPLTETAQALHMIEGRKVRGKIIVRPQA